MKTSLSLRLLIAAAVSTVVALLATALVLNFFFRSYFEERIHNELEAYLILLTGNVKMNAQGAAVVSELPDPRFSEPLSGFYWQVQVEDQPPVLSQSFWSAPLQPKRPDRRGVVEYGSVELPDGARFITGSWRITRQHEGADRELYLLVALDRAQLESSTAGFARNVSISMGVLGAFLVLASWFQVRVGLRPLDSLRSQITRIKSDSTMRLSDDYPSELEPLVFEVNTLLDHQARTIESARTRAGTLAHGLKTPLTIMQALSQELRKADQQTIPGEIDAQVDAMQHLVERELARTRDQLAVQNTWCKVGPVAARIVRAFQRRAGSDHINWRVKIDEEAVCPFDEYALTELLGNLIDNASKWAKSKIEISASGSKSGGDIEIKDDGSGIPEAELDAVMQRGKRLDTDKPGQGLGLSIVRDMALQRGVSFRIGNQRGGGLSAAMSWGTLA